MEKAVVYARYSSHNQTEQSIEGQLAAAQKYAAIKGYQIVHEYCDRAKTGTNDNREEFQKMLKACASKKFTVIIVWKVDRFGRNREEITFNKYRAKKYGVRVEYIAENISEGPEGVILESVLEGMAEYYSLQLSQNVKRGLLETAKKHKAIGGRPPLGYDTDNGYYVINPEEAPIVKTIFEKYAQGMSMTEIQSWLNDNGYRNRNGKKFTKDSLPRMLKNEKYAGTYAYKDLIYDEDAIPAIVSKELFNTVQAKLKYNRRKPSRRWSYTDYLLTDKLFCGHCGSSMIGKSGYGEHGQKYNYYVCNERTLHKTCDKKPVRQDALEAFVLEKVYQLLTDDMIDYLVNITWDYYVDHDASREERRSLQKTIDRLEISLNNLVKSVEDSMPFELVKKRMQELRDELDKNRKLLAEKELEDGLTLTKDHIRFFLLSLKNMEHNDKNVQKRLIETMVNRIYLYDDKATIAFNYSGDNSTITYEDITKTHTAEVRLCVPKQGVAHSKRTFVWRNVVVCEFEFCKK